MIKVELVRHYGTSRVPIGPVEENAIAAAVDLLCRDLSIGGKIIERQPTMIKTHTKKKTFVIEHDTTFTGPEEEIQFLVRVAENFRELNDREFDIPGLKLDDDGERDERLEFMILKACGFNENQMEIYFHLTDSDLNLEYDCNNINGLGNIVPTFLKLIAEGSPEDEVRERIYQLQIERRKKHKIRRVKTIKVQAR